MNIKKLKQFPLLLKEDYSPLIYIVTIGVLIHILNMGISYLLILSGVDVSSLGGIQDSKHNQNIIILVSVLIVPVIETLIGQMLPIHAISKLTSSKNLYGFNINVCILGITCPEQPSLHINNYSGCLSACDNIYFIHGENIQGVPNYICMSCDCKFTLQFLDHYGIRHGLKSTPGN